MTPSRWPKARIGDVLTKSADTVEVETSRTYQQVTVRLWGKGVVPRGEVSGVQLAGNRRHQVKAGQFIVSRIDARHGAFGIVPEELDGAVASNDFPAFNIRTDRLRAGFLGWLCRTHEFIELCRAASEGTTNRVRLKEDRFLEMAFPLPPPREQDRIVAKVDSLAAKIEEAQTTREEIDEQAGAMLQSAFAKAIQGASPRRMEDVAPLARRPVEVRMGEEYPELGVRSFGKGTFHKPALDFLAVGSKRLYRIEPGDLVFNNVFAWEGAVAIAQPEDEGRVGSHRFITCVPEPGVATAEFLCFYFLTREGLERLGEASPGGAGRNRTLGLKRLAKIEVPVPSIKEQRWFNRLQAKVHDLRGAQEDAAADFDAMLPAVLDRAFKGEF